MLIVFSGQYKTENHNKILNQARQRITQAMGVMPIRIQAPKLKYDNSFVYISAMLLDRSPYEGKNLITLKEIISELSAFVSPQKILSLIKIHVYSHMKFTILHSFHRFVTMKIKELQ